MSDPIRSAVHELFASRESTLRGTPFAADARARGLIRRRRAARQAGTTAAVLVGVIALGAGAVAAVDNGLIGPATRAGVDGIVTVHTVGDTTLSVEGLLPGCGEPAPITALNSGDFRFEQRGRAEVTVGDYQGSEARLMGDVVSAATRSTSVAIVGPMGVIASDGVVVGYTGWIPEAFATLERGEAARVSSTVGRSVTVCVDGQPTPKEFLPAGTYDIYPVVRVLGSPEAAAWRVLREGNVMTEPGEELSPSVFSGSPMCENIVEALAETSRFDMPNPNGVLPYECREGVELDFRADTIRVPYPGEYFTGNIDELFVGAPVAVTLMEGHAE